MTTMYAFLEEVVSLLAFIKLHPELPYAHLAEQHAAVAIATLETGLVKDEFIEPLALHSLRVIATNEQIRRWSSLKTSQALR